MEAVIENQRNENEGNEDEGNIKLEKIEEKGEANDPEVERQFLQEKDTLRHEKERQDNAIEVLEYFDENACDLERWMITRLKYKCSVTLISLLEGKQDAEIIGRMLKSLNITVLKRNIVDIFLMFMDIFAGKYTDKCFLKVLLPCVYSNLWGLSLTPIRKPTPMNLTSLSKSALTCFSCIYTILM